MRKVLLTIFLSGFSAIAFAQTADRAKLDAYFKSLDDAGKFMGVVAISKEGQPVYTKALGMADGQQGKKIETSTRFRIGSITKMFTAAMIFKAAEEKKLSIDDKLSKYFPQVPNANSITLGMLLSHRSGIHNFTNDATYKDWESQPKTRVEMLEVISKPASDFAPDSKSDYSNSNYVLLTYILEDIYKKPYAKLLEEKITKPLQLKNTAVGSAINTANKEAYSYRFMGAWEKDSETSMTIPVGAGAIISDYADLTKFIEALFAGKIVSAESLAKMQDIRDGYGMGMFTFAFDGKTSFGHTGGIDSFRSMLAYFPEDRVTFVMLSNGSTYKNNDIGIAALGWLFNKPFDIPQFTRYTYKTEELDQFLGNYTSADIPLKVAITKKGATLFAQATGQEPFPLDATSVNNFKFDRAGVVMEFDPSKKSMKLKQGGVTYNYVIEN